MQYLEILEKQKKPLTVREIASQDVRKAEVFKRFGIEICCGGIMSLESACLNLGLDLVTVEIELDKATTGEENAAPADLNHYNLDVLVDYVYNKHHVYFYKENVLILDLLNKVQSHAKQYPVLNKVNVLYLELQKDLFNHFLYEEIFVFPEIKKLAQLNTTSLYESPANMRSIDEDIKQVRDQHNATIKRLQSFKTTTNNFEAPDVACNSYKLLYHKLKGLDKNLLTHLHVEGQILFPKAMSLYKELQ